MGRQWGRSSLSRQCSSYPSTVASDQICRMWWSVQGKEWWWNVLHSSLSLCTSRYVLVLLVHAMCGPITYHHLTACPFIVNLPISLRRQLQHGRVQGWQFRLVGWANASRWQSMFSSMSSRWMLGTSLYKTENLSSSSAFVFHTWITVNDIIIQCASIVYLLLDVTFHKYVTMASFSIILRASSIFVLLLIGSSRNWVWRWNYKG